MGPERLHVWLASRDGHLAHALPGFVDVLAAFPFLQEVTARGMGHSESKRPAAGAPGRNIRTVDLLTLDRGKFMAAQAVLPRRLAPTQQIPAQHPRFPVPLEKFAAVGRTTSTTRCCVEALRVAPKASLFLVENSLLGLRKFPVPARREFGAKPLIELVN